MARSLILRLRRLPLWARGAFAIAGIALACLSFVAALYLWAWIMGVA
jgi:hypothetical protein